MPVSPQDFELYSRMTGAPMPSDAMSRMQMAPDVYKFTKDFARKPNFLEKTGNLAKNIGKGVVFALGAPMVAESMAETERMNEQLRNEGDKTVAQEVTTQEGLSDEQEKTRRKEIEIQGKKDLLELEAKLAGEASQRQKTNEVASNLIDKVKNEQVTTTADNYGQPLVENQTATNIIDKKVEQGSQIADETPNIAEVLSESEESMPGFSESGNEINIIDGVEEETVGSGITSQKVDNFLDQFPGFGTGEGKNIDPALAIAFANRDNKEKLYLGETSGTIPESPLADHPDIKGGEEPNPSLGMNTGSTVNLNPREEELRNTLRKGLGTMPPEQQEIVLNKMLSPSEKQLRGISPTGKNLLEQRAEANEQAMGSMRLSDEEREKESIRLGSTGGIPNKTDMAKIRKSPEFIAAQESMKPKSTSEKSDNFMDKLVRDAKMEVESQQPQFSTQVDSRKYKEVGINQMGDLYTTYQSDPNRRYSYQTDPGDTEEFTKLIQSGDLGSKPSLLVDAMISRVKKYKEGEQGFTKL